MPTHPTLYLPEALRLMQRDMDRLAGSAVRYVNHPAGKPVRVEVRRRRIPSDRTLQS